MDPFGLEPCDIKSGEGGKFGDFSAGCKTGDQLTLHYMPQAAAYYTLRVDGGALVMPHLSRFKQELMDLKAL